MVLLVSVIQGKPYRWPRACASETGQQRPWVQFSKAAGPSLAVGKEFQAWRKTASRWEASAKA